MGSLISVDKEERITRVDEACSTRTRWDPDALAVSGYQETGGKPHAASARQAWRTPLAWISNSAVWTYKTIKDKVLSRGVDTFEQITQGRTWWSSASLVSFAASKSWWTHTSTTSFTFDAWLS